MTQDNTRAELLPFQQEVDCWMDACFGDVIKADRLERADRFIEEALELCQTEPTFTADRAHALVDYVFGRPVGDPSQEVGGVMVTLAALCNTFGIDVEQAAVTELARVWTKIEQIRAKQAAKPTGSALPVAQRIEAARPSVGAEGLVEKADTTVKECLTVEMAEYSPAGGDRVMIWVNKRRTDLGGYCIEGVPRHAAPTILAALRASPPQEPADTGEVARLREALETIRNEGGQMESRIARAALNPETPDERGDYRKPKRCRLEQEQAA